MQAKIPVLAVTDSNTDIGKVIVDGGFGWWCESDEVESFSKLIQIISKSSHKKLGIQGYKYLVNNYSAEISYKTIIKAIS